MKIVDIRATTVAIPLEAPLRHSNGAHWGRFVRTIVEVEADNGLVGLGELGGGGESAEAGARAMLGYLKGHNPYELEAMRFKICNPTSSLYNNRTQVHAALEFACLDLIGQETGLPVHALLGGALRDEVEFASYLFFRYGDPETGEGEIRTPDQLAAQAQELRARYGFRTHKLKAGVFPPSYEVECFQALAAACPGDGLRFDPNTALSHHDALNVANSIKHLNNEYFEDPVYGLNGMRRLRDRIDLPLATNTVVVNIDQLVENVLRPAVDVVLLDTTFWGGIRPCLKAAAICEAFQIDVGVHSSGELGIQLSTMLHLGAVLPAMTFAADAHYHQLTDDIIVGGKMAYVDGRIAVPQTPGLGVTLDPDRVAKYKEYFAEVGPYPYDRDPHRPDWFALVPNTRWADPTFTTTA